MTTDLDHAVRSSLADIIAAAPLPNDQPLRLMTIDSETPTRRPYLAVAASLVVLAGIGGLVVIGTNDSTPISPAAAPTPTDDSSTGVNATLSNNPSTASTIVAASTGQTRAKDARDDAWRAAVEQEIASLHLDLTITEYGVGSGGLFGGKIICNFTAAGQTLEQAMAFVLTELPADLDTSAAGWQRKTAEFDIVGGSTGTDVTSFDTSGVSIGADAVMFVEPSNGAVRRVAVVTRKHVIVIAAPPIGDKYLPTAEVLTAAAQDLNKLADAILARP